MEYSSVGSSCMELHDSWTWLTVSSHRLGNFSAILSSDISQALSLSPFFWNPYHANISAHMLFQRPLTLPSFLSILFSSSCSTLVMSSTLSSSSLICSPAPFSPLLISSSFDFSYCVYPLWLFFMFSNSVENLASCSVHPFSS